MKKLLSSLFVLTLLCFLLPPIGNVEARSGCCSWHGGVCTYKCPDGVNIGYMCCDGTSLSAKCAPYYPSCPPILIPKCPSHSTYNSSSGSCECNYGYILDSSNKCVARDEYCQDLYGDHTHYDSLKKQCECDYEYKLSNGKCIKEEPKSIQQSPNEQTPQQLGEESQSQKKSQTENKESDLDKLKAQVGEGLLDKENVNAQSNEGGSVWCWIIGIGVVAILFYVFKTRKKRKKDYERRN